MITVKDYYENLFGESVYVTNDLEDAKQFVEQFIDDTDGECNLKIT